MSNELTLFDAPVPAAIQAAFGELDNIPLRQTVPQLSFRGKVFRVVLNGEENIVLNKEGDPVQSVRVIILKLNNDRGRAYFEAYEEGKSQPPLCWSNDSIKPDASIAEPQHPTCAGCPQAAKGAKITDAGKPIAACGTFRKIAVVPTANIQHEPLAIRIPQTSIWDKENKENEAKGFFAFDQYLDFLRKRGVSHTASVMTKIKFDARTAYPKLLFGADNWVPTDWHPAIKELLEDPRLDALINSSVFDASVRTEPAAAAEVDDEPVLTAPPPQRAAAKPAPAPAAAPRVEKGVPPPQSRKPAPPARKAAAAAPPPAADPDDEPVLAGGNGAAGAPVIDSTATVLDNTAAAADKGKLGTLLQGWD